MTFQRTTTTRTQVRKIGGPGSAARTSGNASTDSTTHSSTVRGQSGRQKTIITGIASFLAVATGLTLSGIAVAADSGPTTSEQAAVIAYDAFNRAVGSGWGNAETGGPYTLSSGAATNVSGGAGQVVNLTGGRAFTAGLTSAQASDTRMRVSVRLPALPKSGGGLYIYLGLRTQANSSRYLAKAHVRPNGTVALSFSRAGQTTETFIAPETVIAPKVASGGLLTVEADASGTSPVSLNSHAWVGATPSPNWQVKVTDSSSTRITAAGYVATQIYGSSSTPALSASVTEFTAWRLASQTSPAPTTTTQAPATTQAPTATVSPTTPPTTSRGAGSAAPGTTSYAIAASAIYVSPSGTDSATGRSAAPVRTVAHAIAIAPPGSTIVLRAGTYHESISVPSNKTLDIQSAPNSAVWLEGSSVVSGWIKSGSTWIRTGWNAQFDSTPSYTSQVSTAAFWGFTNAAHPMAAHPDQVWINGTALSQVSSAAAVTAGTFYSDYAGKRIIIGSDPTGKEVRASDLGIAASISSANSSLRGIGIRRYATAVHDMGAVRVLGSNVLVENDVITDMATTAISVLSTKDRVSHLTLKYNGLLGLHANNADNIVVSSVLASNNNTEGFNTSPVAGGIKITRTRNITVRDSVISDNLGTGLWLDESCYNAVIVGNTMASNHKHGFSFEISSTAIVADNVVTGSASDGLKINDADNVRIWNNTLAGNGRNIDLVQDARDGSNASEAGHDKRQAFPDPTMPWKIANIQLRNTTLPPSGQYNVYVRDYTNKRSGAQMAVTIDGNLFTRTTSTGGAIVVWPEAGGKLTIAHSVAELAKTGAGSHNAEVVSGVAPANSSYAQPLPADIAALIGQPAGTRSVGAFYRH